MGVGVGAEHVLDLARGRVDRLGELGDGLECALPFPQPATYGIDSPPTSRPTLELATKGVVFWLGRAWVGARSLAGVGNGCHSRGERAWSSPFRTMCMTVVFCSCDSRLQGST